MFLQIRPFKLSGQLFRNRIINGGDIKANSTTSKSNQAQHESKDLIRNAITSGLMRHNPDQTVRRVLTPDAKRE